jgi:hypothetical protein
LTFRGTDADFALDGEATSGFGQLRYYAQMKPLIDKVYDYISSNDDISKLVVSGHSLGGAVLQIFLLSLMGRDLISWV